MYAPDLELVTGGDYFRQVNYHRKCTDAVLRITWSKNLRISSPVRCVLLIRVVRRDGGRYTPSVFERSSEAHQRAKESMTFALFSPRSKKRCSARVALNHY